MRALGFLPARFCMIAECLAGVLTCCFPNMHGPPYPKTGSGALPKTLVRPMSAVEGCAGRASPWQPRGHSVNPGFPGLQGHSSCEPSTVVQRPNSLSYRVLEGQNSLPSRRSARAASEHPETHPHPYVPSLAVAIPSSSSYPPVPVSRRPRPAARRRHGDR